MLGPEGKELPPGHGTAKEGAEIFAKRCAVCHGQNGEGGVVRRLVVGSPGHPHRGPFKDAEKDGPSYYPYPTIAWDYINRAMPASKPGSLTHDEVYAVVAFLLLSERHHPGERRPGRQESAEGRNAEPGWLRSGSAGVSPGKETQLVLSESRLRFIRATSAAIVARIGGWRPGLVTIGLSRQRPLHPRRSQRQVAQAFAGRGVELPFNEGQWVKAGTLIARMEDSDYRASK